MIYSDMKKDKVEVEGTRGDLIIEFGVIVENLIYDKFFNKDKTEFIKFMSSITKEVVKNAGNSIDYEGEDDE